MLRRFASRWKRKWVTPSPKEKKYTGKECDERHERSENAAAIREIKSAYIDAHKNDDRHESWRSAREWTTISLVAITLVITGITGCIFHDQLNESRDEQRPWIAPPIIHNAIISNNIVPINMIFEDIGKTPTKGFWVDAKIVHATNDFATEITGLCRERRSYYAKHTNNYTAVPNSLWPIPLGRVPSRVGLKSASVEKPYLIDEIRKIGNAHIIGCAFYGVDRVDNIHETDFYGPIIINRRTVSIGEVYAVNAN